MLKLHKYSLENLLLKIIILFCDVPAQERVNECFINIISILFVQVDGKCCRIENRKQIIVDLQILHSPVFPLWDPS